MKERREGRKKIKKTTPKINKQINKKFDPAGHNHPIKGRKMATKPQGLARKAALDQDFGPRVLSSGIQHLGTVAG